MCWFTKYINQLQNPDVYYDAAKKQLMTGWVRELSGYELPNQPI